MLLKKTGITGYSISLATSVNKLTSERIQIVLVITFTFMAMNNGQ